MFDMILKNANILDGTNKSSFIGDIGIKKGVIEKIGKMNSDEAFNLFDCRDLYVSPGFIDAHSHDDQVFGNTFTELGKISQGITTVVAGQCGSSLAPVKKETFNLFEKSLSDYMTIDKKELKKYTSFKNYLKCLKNKNSRLNYKLLIGHGTIRMSVMGVEKREPTIQELEEMKNMVHEAMKNGASGMSTGLIYPPAVYAKKDEIIELLKVVNKHGGFYATHLRNESNQVIESIIEAIDTAEKANVPLCISHHKIAGKQNWYLSKETLRIIEEKIKEGMDIIIDQYPYNSGMTNLSMVLPPHYYEGGIKKMVERIKDPKLRKEAVKEILNPTYEWDNFYKNCNGFKGILIAEAYSTKDAQGKTIKEYAKEINKDEFETFFDLLIENDGKPVAIYFAMNEKDIVNIIKFPYTVIGTDGVSFNRKTIAHPRGFGSFTKVISTYVKSKKILSLEEAIYKMTALTAQKLKIKNKGKIVEGYDADLVVFNYETIEDKASYNDPFNVSEGIELVIINGKIAYKDKKLTDNYSGKII